MATRFMWNERNIQWFSDASAYTGFHRELAQKIAPYLRRSDTLLDAGCGLGRLDLELAMYVSEITAVDISEDALDALRRGAAHSGIQNISTRCCDASSLSECFDVVLLSFFGQFNTPDFLRLCRRKLIRIVSAENKSSLYPERHRRGEKDTVPIVQRELKAQGIRFQTERYSIEFGQPFRSRADAELFVLQNAPGASREEISDFLDQNLVPAERGGFPFYLPNQKELGIFIIDKER